MCVKLYARYIYSQHFANIRKLTTLNCEIYYTTYLQDGGGDYSRQNYVAVTL